MVSEVETLKLLVNTNILGASPGVGGGIGFSIQEPGPRWFGVRALAEGF